MGQKRFNSLNELCEESKKAFSSVNDAKNLLDRMEEICESENTPPSEAEISLVHIIKDRAFIRLFELLSKINVENIELSDEDLAKLKIQKNNFPELARAYEEDAELLKRSPSETLRKLAQAKRDKILKNIEPAKELLSQIIQKEETRRQQPPPRDNSFLEKQITDLKSRIKVLENKKTQTPSNSADFQRYEREIQQLKSELKEKEKKNTQKGDNFP